jgi:hypothetical protein
MSATNSQSEQPPSSAKSHVESDEQHNDEMAYDQSVKSVSSKRFLDNIDGGLRGWLTVLGAWLFQFSMVGAVTAFGSYQTFYESDWLNVSQLSLTQRGERLI